MDAALPNRSDSTAMTGRATLSDPLAVIVAELEGARAGESERQLRDVVGILAASGPDLERDYLEHWIGALGLEGLWARARSAAD